MKEPRAFDLSTKGKLWITGDQAAWFLDQLLTNKLDDLQTGETKEALLLNPRGRIVNWMTVHAAEDGIFVEVDNNAAALATFFNERVFTTQVNIEDVSDRYGLIRVLDPEPKLIERLTEIAHVTMFIPLWSAVDFIFEASTIDSFVSLLSLVGQDDLENVRITKGIPGYGIDFDDTFLPQEAALERAVHFSKGCYLGQEAVAMAQRGSVKRRLRRLSSPERFDRGDLVRDGQVVGTTTSVVEAKDGFLGIGVLKTAVGVGQLVDSDGTAVTIEPLPGTIEGPAVPSARELRERLERRA